MYVRILLTLGLLSLSAIGNAAGSDAPSAKFTVRHKTEDAPAPRRGDLIIRVTNAIPKVEVPQPHLPTVFHLNAVLCSVAPLERDATDVDSSGRTTRRRPDGSSRCLDLSPTIYADTSETFVVAHKDFAGLINGDYRLLRLRFKSSSQTTSYAYPCWSKRSIVEFLPDQTNEINVTVDGQHSTHFNCR